VCRQSVFASDFVAPCYGCLAFFVLENVKYVALIWDVGGLLLKKNLRPLNLARQ